MNSWKCHFCNECNGKACYGQMPGMGCPEGNYNFSLNRSGWKELPPASIDTKLPELLLAPMAGAVENMGFEDEKSYYPLMMNAAAAAGVKLSIGDGAPDEKLHYAADGVRYAAKNFPGTKAVVFLKPYPNEKLFQRVEWTEDIAQSFGTDIDSYNIITMRNKAHLEKKTPEALKELMDFVHHKGFPFIVKGVFAKDDIEMMAELKPDAVYISNHGGRVSAPQGSTVSVLKNYGSFLKNCCGQIWIDGGIRTKEDLLNASILGASVAGIGRPFATALCRNGKDGVSELVKSLK